MLLFILQQKKIEYYVKARMNKVINVDVAVWASVCTFFLCICRASPKQITTVHCMIKSMRDFFSVIC